MPKVKNTRNKAASPFLKGSPYQTKKPSNQAANVASVDKESNGLNKTNCDTQSDESDYEEFDVTQYKLSEYESTRIENIYRNKQILQSFNILEAKEQYNITKPRTEKKKSFDVGLKRTLNEKIPLPRRVSLRIKNLPVSYTDLPPIETSQQNAYYSPRRAPKLSMQAANISGDHGKSAMESWSKLQNSTTEVINFKKFQDQTQKLDIKYVAKVTNERIYSVAIHPSCDKILACAGDKSGNVGIWDVNSTQGKSTEVFLFSPHTQPINCLKFCQTDFSKLYSCSFDGSVRVADFSSQQFSEVCSIEENTDRFNYFAWPANKSNTMLVASSSGNVLLLDTRTRSCIEQNYQIFSKSVRCVDFHPQKEHLFAASSFDGILATWDLRNLKKDNNKFLSMFRASKTTSTCFFSPGAGDKLLLTSQDDCLRVFHVDQVGKIESPPKWNVKHDNFTGRWLTSFRACWDPKTENCFVCGSMQRPRQIDMFGCMEDGFLSQFSITSEEQTTVASVNAFHSSQNILISGNASGRMYIWM